MSEFCHTQGKWIVYPRFSCHTNIKNQLGVDIASTACDDEKQPHRADAALIAAAPDLALFAKSIVDAAEDVEDCQEFIDVLVLNSRKLLAEIHPKVLHGECPLCGHTGQDCTGFEEE